MLKLFYFGSTLYQTGLIVAFWKIYLGKLIKDIQIDAEWMHGLK